MRDGVLPWCGLQSDLKKRAGSLLPFVCVNAVFRWKSQRDDVRRLQALGALHDVEFNGRAFRKRAEAAALDRRKMNKQIVAALAGDEAEALRVVEPLDGTGCFHG